MGERLGRQLAPLVQGKPPWQGGQHVGVPGRVGDDGHASRGSWPRPGPSTGRRCRSARRTRSGAAPEATVASNGYRFDTSSWNGSMPSPASWASWDGSGGVRQQARVDPRVQRLDPPVQALGEPGQLLHPGDRHPRGHDPGGGAAGGDDLDAGRVQPGGEVLEPGLVVDADERPPDRDLSQLADPHLPAADGPAFADHPAYRADEQRPLGHLDPLVQRRLVVIVLDRHAGLGHDRPLVDAVVHEEDGAARRSSPRAPARPARRASRGTTVAAPGACSGSGRRTRPGMPCRPAS